MLTSAAAVLEYEKDLDEDHQHDQGEDRLQRVDQLPRGQAVAKDVGHGDAGDAFGRPSSDPGASTPSSSDLPGLFDSPHVTSDLDEKWSTRGEAKN